MHRLITFARDDSAPARTLTARRRPTIDEFQPRRSLVGAPSLLKVTAPAVWVAPPGDSDSAGSSCVPVRSFD